MKPAENISLSDVVRRSLNESQQPYFHVTSNSMSPLIRKGDDVQVSHQGTGQLTPGDIVVVADEAGFLTHRLWLTYSIHGIPYILLRGDSLKAYDPPCQASQIIGRVIARRRNSQVLDLTEGIGCTLNNWLIKFASLANPPFPALTDVQTSVPYPIASDTKSNPPLIRIRNRLLVTAATALTAIVDLLNGI